MNSCACACAPANLPPLPREREHEPGVVLGDSTCHPVLSVAAYNVVSSPFNRSELQGSGTT